MYKRKVKVWILWGLSLFLSSLHVSALAAIPSGDSSSVHPKVFVIDELYEDKFSVAEYVYLLEDPGHELSVQEVREMDFLLTHDFVVQGNVFHNYSRFWMKLYVRNELPVETDWIIVMSPKNSYVNFYEEKEDGTFAVKRNGRLLPAHVKEFEKHEDITFSVELPAHTTKVLYFSISRNVNFPPRSDLHLEARSYWETNTNNENRFVALGVLQGALLMMAFFFFVYYLSSRYRTYFYYAVFLIFQAFYILYDRYGTYVEDLLGEHTYYMLHLWVFVNFLYIFFAIFVRSFVNAPRLIPQWDFLFKLLIYTRLVCAMIALGIIIRWYDHHLADLVYEVYLMPFELVCWLVLTVVLFQKGNKLIRIFMLGVIVYITTAMGFAHIIINTELDDDWLVYVHTVGFLLQFLFFSSVLGFRSYLLNQEKERARQQYIEQLQKNQKLQLRVNTELEEKVKERTAKIELQNKALIEQSQRLRELDESKSQFFANISHEFRTPLTLMLGPLQRLYEQTSSDTLKSQYTQMMYHGENLLDLINQLLELAQQRETKVGLKATEMNVIDYIKNIAISFVPYAESKKIDYQYQFPRDPVIACCDALKLRRVVENLLSNAFKFTPVAGKIKLLLSEAQDNFCLEISDSGIGIPEEKLPYIFDRFYQVSSPESRNYGGTGIGLSLVKEYVKLHHGEVHVESKKGKGTRFLVTIPLKQQDVTADDTVAWKLEEAVPVVERKLLSYQPQKEELHADIIADGKPDILIVEDNQFVRKFLKESLQQHYHLVEARNGEEGLMLATSRLPDLIISDLMMPGISGLEFCQQIKENELTNHIPIIMLTARADMETRLNGWQVGADEYITKPFNVQELQVRIKNLLDSRKMLQQKFMRKFFGEKPAASAKVPEDDLFLQKLQQVLEKYYKDANLQVEELTREMGMSRSQFYRKIKSTTGESPNSLIRKFRLHQAARLLEEEYGSISMISDAVGFNNDSYFSKCFQQEFGHLPSEHLANIQKD